MPNTEISYEELMEMRNEIQDDERDIRYPEEYYEM